MRKSGLPGSSGGSAEPTCHPERSEGSAGFSPQAATLLPMEKQLIVELEKYPAVIKQAGDEMNPSAIAIYIFTIAKIFSSFYTEHSIANAETEEKKQLRLQLAGMTANVIKSGMQLLGIDVPERM